jgi:negative regulator of sigma-B (phosphoserine phosphatase)
MEDLNSKVGGERTTCALFDYAVASSPLHGESVSGDAYYVRCDENRGVVAVIDALGHGKEAAIVAEKAVLTLQKNSTSPIEKLLTNCHESLKGTRGVVMITAVLEGREARLNWAGVGDIEGLLIKEKKPDVDDNHKGRCKHNVEYILMRPGVVGWTLPTTHVGSVALTVGDILIMTTDGIKNEFTNDVEITQDLNIIAGHIMSHYSKGHDDSLVVGLRWRGVADQQNGVVKKSRTGGVSDQ